MNIRTTVAATAAAVLLSGLSGCGSDQTVEEACEIAQPELLRARSDFAALRALEEDPNADPVQVMVDSMKATERKIGNRDVKEAVHDVRVANDRFHSLISSLQDASSSERDELEEKIEPAQADRDRSEGALLRLCG